MKEIVKETALEAINRWLNGKATANDIRAEFGLERVESDYADEFIDNYKAVGEIVCKAIEKADTFADEAAGRNKTDGNMESITKQVSEVFRRKSRNG